MELKINKLVIGLVGVIIFFVSWNMFNAMYYDSVISDLQAHLHSSHLYNATGKKLPAHFLYFFIVSLFSGFSADLDILKASSMFILSVSIVFRFILTYLIINYFISREIKITNNLKSIIAVISGAITFVFPLPHPALFEKGWMYVGQIMPTVWHNSTIIFSIPFSLLLFFYTLKLFENPSKRYYIITFALVILNIISKPSFFLVYVVATPLYYLYYYRSHIISIKRILLLSPILLGILILIIQTILIYGGDKSDGGIEIAFCKMWSFVYNGYKLGNMPLHVNMLISLVTSFAFPIVVLFLIPNSISNKSTVYSIIILIVSLLIHMFLIETGSRATHGNFGWQRIPATLLFFITTSIVTISAYRNKVISNRRLLFISIIFIMHFIQGVVYYNYILDSKTFM